MARSVRGMRIARAMFRRVLECREVLADILVGNVSCGVEVMRDGCGGMYLLLFFLFLHE
jgi:hypothetical protein